MARSQSSTSTLKDSPRQFGGSTLIEKDGSMYASIGTRPVPPPKAMRKLHEQRQEELRQVVEERETEAFERQLGLSVNENRTLLNVAKGAAADSNLKREMAQRDIEVQLRDLAWSYKVEHGGIMDCNGVYTYAEAARNGAPVYCKADGWSLHRDEPSEENSIGNDVEMKHFGWILSKDCLPFYASKTEELAVPGSGWQCFYGSSPAPMCSVIESFEGHFLQVCEELKAGGNTAVQEGQYDLAEECYSEACKIMEIYDEVVTSSKKLEDLQVALRANRAEARLRLRLWSLSLEDSLWVVQKLPFHEKAIIRMCKASKALGSLGNVQTILEGLLAQACSRGCKNRQAVQFLAEARVLNVFEQLSSLEEPTKADKQQENADTRSLKKLLKTHKLASQLLKVTSHEAQSVKQELCNELDYLRACDAQDIELKEFLSTLLSAHGILDLAFKVLDDEIGSSSYELPGMNSLEDDEAALYWPLDVICACASAIPDLAGVLTLLPRWVKILAKKPLRALQLADALLRHKLQADLFVADKLVEAKGFLASLLRQWTRYLDLSSGEATAAFAARVLMD